MDFFCSFTGLFGTDSVRLLLNYTWLPFQLFSLISPLPHWLSFAYSLPSNSKDDFAEERKALRWYVLFYVFLLNDARTIDCPEDTGHLIEVYSPKCLVNAYSSVRTASYCIQTTTFVGLNGFSFWCRYLCLKCSWFTCSSLCLGVAEFMVVLESWIMWMTCTTALRTQKSIIKKLYKQ